MSRKEQQPEDRQGDQGASESSPLSRREFLTRAALGGGIAVAVPSLLLLKQKINTDNQRELAEKTAYNANAGEREQRAERDRLVKTGMAHFWKEANVWPGLAIMPPNVKLFGTVLLDEDSEISWPKDHRNEHLAVQRPFLVLESMKDQGFRPIHGPDGDLPPRPGVMGFWMPDSQQIAFCDQEAFRSQILMPTNSTEPIFRPNTDREGIVGEHVDMEPATHRGGLTYRYLEYTNPQFGYQDTVHKVLGRSDWLGLQQEAVAFDAFLTGQGDDIVQLPGAH